MSKDFALESVAEVDLLKLGWKARQVSIAEGLRYLEDDLTGLNSEAKKGALYLEGLLRLLNFVDKFPVVISY